MRTDRSDRPRGLRGPRRLRVLWIGLVFAGVLMMHGLSGHGSPVMPEPALAGHLHHVADDPGAGDTDPLHATGPASQPAGGDGHSGHLMIMSLCLAFLVTAAIALLLRGRPLGRARRRWGVVVALPSLAWSSVPLRPPDLTVLQVCRC